MMLGQRVRVEQTEDPTAQKWLGRVGIVNHINGGKVFVRFPDGKGDLFFPEELAALDPAPDVLVANHGSIFIVTPATEAGRTWIDNNIAPDALTWGNGVAVEHRFIAAIVAGAIKDGLTVQTV